MNEFVHVRQASCTTQLAGRVSVTPSLLPKSSPNQTPSQFHPPPPRPPPPPSSQRVSILSFPHRRYTDIGSRAEVMTSADADAAASLRSSIAPANLPLISALLACAIAQFLKPFTTWLKDNKWDSTRMLSSGGMPSSHSATVTALATAIGLQEGVGAASFSVAVVLACVVMYDATGIRLHAGRQAELLNQIVCELPPEHPVAIANVRPLRDSLGHTPLQVAAGALLGCLVAFLLRSST